MTAQTEIQQPFKLADACNSAGLSIQCSPPRGGVDETGDKAWPHIDLSRNFGKPRKTTNPKPSHKMRTSGILDSRDLAKRLDELQELRDALEAAREERKELGYNLGSTESEIEAADDAVEAAEAEFSEDEKRELEELENLESEVSEWRGGATLIPESEWVDYVKQLCEDIGDIPRDLPGYIEINWDATADNIRANYSETEFQGTTYLHRS